MLTGYAVFSWLLSRYWERLSPHASRCLPLIVADTFVASAILGVGGPSGAFFLATLFTSTAAGVRYGVRGVAGVSTLQVLGYLAAVFVPSGGPVEAGATVWTGVQVVVVHPLLYPVAGHIGLRLRGLFEELTSEQERRRVAERAAAAAEERTRLARDMHDSVAKTLRGIALAAQALPLWLERDPERAAATAAQVVAAAGTAVREIRELITDLRESPAGPSVADGVAAVLREWSAQTGVAAGLCVRGTPLPLPVVARHETVAVLREALTNIDRHSAAETVTVELAAEAEHLVMTVRDNGRGFDPVLPLPGRYGLVGMRERAARAGGSLTLTSATGSGTTVTLRVPMADTPSEDREPSP
ncbi:sensor histidine kinase [Thermobifida halotolerans]|uniref:Sensor histidine kinase n=2 Tax=Thermobifida halotolerans TaxID=483545 RepID=A0AA97M6C0_9ACTN|nr:sensor histidine kinase [Thermobifida halotolerans]